MSVRDVSEQSIPALVSLAGRRAAVTGGAKGIGYAIAQRLAEAGADVVIGDVEVEEAVAAATRLAASFDVEVTSRALDVGVGSSVVAFADAVAERGAIDIWVSNAGIYPTVPVLEMTDADWDRVLEVNLRGAFVGAREAARRMVAAGTEGVIVNIASTAAFKVAGPGLAHYASSKHGMLGLTKSLAIELAPHGIRVLGVAPTLIATPGIDANRKAFADAGLGDVIDELGSSLPLGRVGLPDDVARVVLFCASDLSLFMTGSTLAVDAGDLAR